MNITIPTAGEGRVVEHVGNAVDKSVIMDKTGYAEFRHAVGYLSTWNMSFPHVKLFYNARDIEITAVYYNEAGELSYCINAVFNDSAHSFGFHS